MENPNLRLAEFPSSKYLGETLSSNFNETTLKVFQRYLFDPVDDLLSRPSKQIRAKLVDATFRAFSDSKVDASVLAAQKIVETLHAGSLVIDDIQDHSDYRRGDLSIHRKYGIEKSIAVGNWLYFWPHQLISSSVTSETVREQMQKACLKTLEIAHYGQLLDLSVNMFTTDQEDCFDLSECVIRAKTGSMIALAVDLGAICAKACEDERLRIREFGFRFGSCLQRFDDIGNVFSESEKQFEDLIAGKPSWFWAYASNILPTSEYHEFISSVKNLPHSEIDESLKVGAIVNAKQHLDDCLQMIKDLPNREQFSEIAAMVANAYV